jgi:hypothetical protein
VDERGTEPFAGLLMVQTTTLDDAAKREKKRKAAERALWKSQMTRLNKMVKKKG